MNNPFRRVVALCLRITMCEILVSLRRFCRESTQGTNADVLATEGTEPTENDSFAALSVSSVPSVVELL